MPPESDALPDLVRRFVAEATGYPLDRVQMETRPSEDLGVDGDDAVELLEAFVERFGVDLSELRFDRHFAPEGLPFSAGLILSLGAVGLMLLWVWAWWAALLGAALVVVLWKRQAPNSYALRVRHLVVAAEMGRWDDDAMGLPEIVD